MKSLFHIIPSFRKKYVMKSIAKKAQHVIQDICLLPSSVQHSFTMLVPGEEQLVGGTAAAAAVDGAAGAPGCDAHHCAPPGHCSVRPVICQGWIISFTIKQGTGGCVMNEKKKTEKMPGSIFQHVSA